MITKGSIVEITGGPQAGKSGLVVNLPDTHRKHYCVSTTFSNRSYVGVQPEDLKLMERGDRRQGFDLQLDFAPILNGFFEVPNWRSLDDLAAGVSILASGAGLHEVKGVQHVRLPGKASTSWARAFLDTEQFGGLSGSGYLMVYQSATYDGNKPQGQGIIGQFAICLHEKKSTGGNPGRGYSPGFCAKCGLNMTVDSSD